MDLIGYPSLVLGKFADDIEFEELRQEVGMLTTTLVAYRLGLGKALRDLCKAQKYHCPLTQPLASLHETGQGEGDQTMVIA